MYSIHSILSFTCACKVTQRHSVLAALPVLILWDIYSQTFVVYLICFVLRFWLFYLFLFLSLLLYFSIWWRFCFLYVFYSNISNLELWSVISIICSAHNLIPACFRHVQYKLLVVPKEIKIWCQRPDYTITIITSLHKLHRRWGILTAAYKSQVLKSYLFHALYVYLFVFKTRTLYEKKGHSERQTKINWLKTRPWRCRPATAGRHWLLFVPVHILWDIILLGRKKTTMQHFVIHGPCIMVSKQWWKVVNLVMSQIRNPNWLHYPLRLRRVYLRLFFAYPVKK